MSDLLSQLLTPQVMTALIVIAIIIILLYLISIIWVFVDARRRDTPAILWAIIAIVPIAGLVAYCLLRPPLTIMDQDEQDMELDLRQRQLDEYGECPNCGYATKSDYVMCPQCHTQLRNLCRRCGRTLEPEWGVCPYCTNPVGREEE